VKSRGIRKIFIWIFTCENADIPYNFLYGASLVLHLCKRTCPTWFTRWLTNETFFWNWRAAPTSLLTSIAAQRFRHKTKDKKLFALSQVTASLLQNWRVFVAAIFEFIDTHCTRTPTCCWQISNWTHSLTPTSFTIIPQFWALELFVSGSYCYWVIL